jgi:hypothetical protein
MPGCKKFRLAPLENEEILKSCSVVRPAPMHLPWHQAQMRDWMVQIVIMMMSRR